MVAATPVIWVERDTDAPVIRNAAEPEGEEACVTEHGNIYDGTWSRKPKGLPEMGRGEHKARGRKPRYAYC